MKRARVTLAITSASVVLPLPGGPHRMSEGTWSASIARRSRRPGPMSDSWPTNSPSERGRIRAARGVVGSSFMAREILMKLRCVGYCQHSAMHLRRRTGLWRRRTAGRRAASDGGSGSAKGTLHVVVAQQVEEDERRDDQTKQAQEVAIE